MTKTTLSYEDLREICTKEELIEFRDTMAKQAVLEPDEEKALEAFKAARELNEHMKAWAQAGLI